MQSFIYPEKKRQGYVYYDKFQYQGKSYYLNTIVDLKHKCGVKDIKLMQVVEAGICDCGKKYWVYAIWKSNGYVRYNVSYISPDEEILEIIEPAKQPPKILPTEYYKDSEVSGMFGAWVLYFAIMFFGMIFRDFIVLWVMGTIFFYVWRKMKLQKPAKHDFGFDIEKKVREWNEWQT